MLLSDIATPSFVVDIDSIVYPSATTATATTTTCTTTTSTPQPSKSSNFDPECESLQVRVPSLYLPKFGTTLYPTKVAGGGSFDDDKEGDYPDNATTLLKYEFTEEQSQSRSQSQSQRQHQKNNAVGYLHSSVIRAREDVTDDDAPISTFLAEVDLKQSLCSFNLGRGSTGNSNDTVKAHLVLGLNNHHVGSYYWARSAGMGSSMEAPGVLFGPSSSSDGMDKGIIRWERVGGNSNDGKRSEWVNFLRRGDNVQFLPACEQEAIMAFVKTYEIDKSKDESRIYGISSKGRKLGSEPLVVCRWTLQ